MSPRAAGSRSTTSTASGSSCSGKRRSVEWTPSWARRRASSSSIGACWAPASSCSIAQEGRDSMFVDKLLLVSDAQALAATALATDKIDLGAYQTLRNRIGDGESMGFLVTVDVAADKVTGDETYQFDVVSDEDSAFGSVLV